MRTARLTMGTGETWDVELTPAEARTMSLEILTLGRAGLAPVRSRVPVVVRE
jgi:hypothetical protein